MKMKIKALLAVAGLGFGMAALPAQAHDHDWHGRDDRGHHDGGWHDRRDDWRGHDWRGYEGRERYVEARPYWAPRPVYRPYYAAPRAWCPPVYERYPHSRRGDASIVLSVPLF
jgi:hypothetical protein